MRKQPRLGNNPLAWLTSTTIENEKAIGKTMHDEASIVTDNTSDLKKLMLNKLTQKSKSNTYYFLPFSAKTTKALEHRLQDLLNWLEGEGANERLEDIAYTLLVGRTHFNKRSVLLVRDLAELISGLQSIASNGSAPNYITKSQRKRKETSDTETISLGNEWLKQLANDDKPEEEQRLLLLKIADLYLQRADLNWNLIGNKGKRISLPTYPFSKERFWVPENASKLRTSSQQNKVQTTFTDSEINSMLYGIEWVSLPLIAMQQQSSIHRVLVLEAGDGYSQHVMQRLQSITGLNIDVITVVAGNEYSSLESEAIRIRTDVAEDYVRLFKSLKLQNRLPDLFINFIPFSNIEGNMESQLSIGIHVYFHLVRTLDELSVQTLKRILHLYPTSCPKQASFHEAVGGYTRSLKMVQPALQFSVIGVQNCNREELIELSIQEALKPLSDQDSEIRYDNKLRTVRRAKRIIINTNHEMTMLKHQGVYLITGGTGGLGYLFAEELAVRYKARLALIGRSELDTKRQLKIDLLRDLGADVIYIQGDVGKRIDMKKAFESVKERWGHVDGVLHSAGLLDEELILHKTKEKFTSIMQPKIEGTVILDELTSNEEIDFFALFSSTSSYLGDIGQCDYAIGNRFLDSYTAYREILRLQGKRYGRTLSINWPIWRDGGMHLDKDAEELYLQSTGMRYLEKEEGLSAFKQLLNSGLSQGMVLAGNREHIERFLDIEKIEPAKEIVIKNSIEDNMITTTKHKFLSDLKQIAADYAKMLPEKFDTEENLGSYGFDSIDLKKLAKSIGDFFQIPVSPTVFFAYSTLQSISEHLLDSFGESIYKHYSYVESTMPKTSIEQISQKVDTLEWKGMINQSVDGSIAPVVESMLEPVAIIGVHGIFPQSNELDDFWRNLIDKKDLITEIPSERWNYRDYYKEGHPAKGKQNTKWGGFIHDVDKFDPNFFHISPREAELMDPQHRLFLESVWKTIENAGYRSSSLAGRNVGVFVGAQFNDYHQLLDQQGIFHANLATGNAHTMLPNRVSHLMDWHGPSEAIDTACSSSLVAIHRAVKSIQNGESELAVAGGVSLILNPQTLTTISQLGVLSPDGRCRTFDTRANGYVRGEGVGSILLKPLSKAKVDGDHIYAVIRGSAENHGGKSNSLTAPNSEAQASVLLRAYEEAGVDPEHITYIETHGTGTELGDPVEIDGLKKAFRDLYKRRGQTPIKRNYCGLGSIKTNIGHLEPASGIAGVLKVVLAIQHQMLPGTVHFQQKNPYIDIDDSPFYIIDKTGLWTTDMDVEGRKIPKIAGVSSFGFGGSNAHVVIEEFSPVTQHVPSNEPQVIVLSAKTEERLKAYAIDLYRFLTPNKDVDRKPDISKSEAYELLCRDLSQDISRLTHLQLREIEVYDAYEDLVFTDSMLMEQFTQIVRERYGLDMQVDWLSNCSSLDKLASKIMIDQQASICDYYGKSLSLSQEGDSKSISQSSESNYSLADLAYTLQIGREAMDQRLAIVASTIEELIDKLAEYIQGRADKRTVLQGNVVGQVRLSFLDGEAGKKFIEMVQQNGEMNKMAELWTLGIDINWDFIHRGYKPKRVPAPTYPFSRERYWFPSKALMNNGDTAVSRLHPILERNSSTFYEQKFTTTLQGDEFYLADHTVSGHQILPGVSILEMARKAGELASLSSVYKIGNIMWVEPVEVINDKRQEINMSLCINEENQIEFELYTINDEIRIVHAQGMMHTSSEETQQIEQFIDLAELREKLKQRMNGEACYQWFNQIGLEYGPSFRIVEELWHDDYEALSLLRLPKHLEESFYEWGLHPSLLDGALHTISAIQHFSQPQTLSLPFALDELEILQPLAPVCYSYMKLVAEDGRLRKYDITITDEIGRVLVKMKNFMVKPIKKVELDQPDQLLGLFQKLHDGELTVNEVEHLARRFV